ncbi:MAG TPA: MBL fold metallo-hydrolase, partial [Gemmataceae bacterium]|nr:MBL fold metallo-hydrolase [Gemmataceae bacterium]
MELCFADVGQGSSTIVLLGARRALVVDAGGKQALTVIRLLQHFQIESIERLIITHNHEDHSRGAAEVLTAFSKRIGQVWCVFDDVLLNSFFWRRLTEEVNLQRLRREQIMRLERDERPRSVFNDGDAFLDVIA